MKIIRFGKREFCITRVAYSLCKKLRANLAQVMSAKTYLHLHFAYQSLMLISEIHRYDPDVKDWCRIKLIRRPVSVMVSKCIA